MTTSTTYDEVKSPGLGGHRFDTKTIHAVDAAKSIPATLTQADELFRQANALYWGLAQEDSPRLDRLFEAGRKLQQAEKLLGYIDFEEISNVGGKLDFSHASARRYIRLARHADAIRAAGLTKVMDADQFALALEYPRSEQVNELERLPMMPVATTLVSENESRIFNDMRCLPAKDQPAFVADLVGRLNHLQSLFARNV